LQTGGFKPVNHYRVAGRIETASEWHEVTVSVRVPEQSTRSLVTASISPTHLEVTVSRPQDDEVGTLAVAGGEVPRGPPSAARDGRPYLWWRRRLQQRTLKYEDGHTSRTHVDTANSTWLLGTDGTGQRCVQFVLAQWMEGANKNQEEAIRKQLQKTGLSVLTEDSDPFHLFELLEAEVWLRAGAVYKARAALCEAARDLIKEMEGHEEREGRDPAALRKSPLADLWEEDAWQGSSDEEEEEVEGPAYGAAWTGRKTDAPQTEPQGGGEVDDAARWWEAERAAELDTWRQAVERAVAAGEARRVHMEEARREAEARAAAAAADRRESEDREAARRRKDLLREHQRLVAAAREAEARPAGAAAAGTHMKKVEAAIGAEAMRSAAAAAARANPLPPKPISPFNSAHSATGCAADPTCASSTAPTAGDNGVLPAAGAVHSLAKCGYWFEDAGEAVKVTVPLADACGSAELSGDCATCDFSRLGARLEVRTPTGCHVLTLPELFKDIVPEESELKIRVKTKRAVLIMKKREPGTSWHKLAAV
jgi:hypothetical protein